MTTGLKDESNVFVTEQQHPLTYHISCTDPNRGALFNGFWKTVWVLTIVSGAMFTLGFTLHKFRYFPYAQLQQLVSRIAPRDEKAAKLFRSHREFIHHYVLLLNF